MPLGQYRYDIKLQNNDSKNPVISVNICTEK